MSLRSFVRKAAELVVELPPEEPLKESEPISDAVSSSSGSATDKMWAELEKTTRTSASSATQTKSVAQIVREGEGPDLDQIQVRAGSVTTVTGPDGTAHFPSIYQAANLPSVPFSSEQILDMLAALPADLPLDIKRQMIKVSLNAMGKAIGATSENIVADASRKLAALAAYTEHLSETTAEYTALSEQKIATLQAQIEETRQAMTAAQQKLAQETQICTAESHRLDEVLEFFSLDVPPSKYAPPDGGRG